MIFIIAILVIIALFVLSFSLTSMFSVSNKDEYIKIGFVGPLTGNRAFLGIPEVNGLYLAAKEINAQGGINGKKIIVLYEDSLDSPKYANISANKLITVDNVDILISSTTSISESIIPLSIQNNKLLFIFSTNPTLAKKSNNIFRYYFDILKRMCFCEDLNNDCTILYL